MIDWHQRRNPADVPTPVAVALADFCRRADAPASATQVRRALAAIEEAEDFQVQALAEEPPGATPLGPYAAVEVAMGLDPELAAQREETGYYLLVEQLIDARQPRPTPPAAPAPTRSRGSTAAPEAPATPPARRPSKVERIQERVQPIKRTPEASSLPPMSGLAALPKRSLPPPRGRFTNVDPSRASIDSLMRDEGAEATVVSLVEQMPTRFSLLKTLSTGYTARGGAPITIDDVEDVLAHHGLLQEIARKERESILTHLQDQKGALGRTASVLSLTAGQLEGLIRALKLTKEVAELRQRFIREALSPANLSLRLDLLGRGKYLDDLEIGGKFREALSRDLKHLLADVDASGTFDKRLERLAKKHALHLELVRRAADRLGLKAE